VKGIYYGVLFTKILSRINLSPETENTSQ